MGGSKAGGAERCGSPARISGGAGGRDRGRLRGGELLGPSDDLEPAVPVFDDRRAAFDPVAAIDVAHAKIGVVGGVMDVAADYAVSVIALGFGGECFFERADEI